MQTCRFEQYRQTRARPRQEKMEVGGANAIDATPAKKRNLGRTKVICTEPIDDDRRRWRIVNNKIKHVLAQAMVAKRLAGTNADGVPRISIKLVVDGEYSRTHRSRTLVYSSTPFTDDERAYWTAENDEREIVDDTHFDEVVLGAAPPDGRKRLFAMRNVYTHSTYYTSKNEERLARKAERNAARKIVQATRTLTEAGITVGGAATAKRAELARQLKTIPNFHARLQKQHAARRPVILPPIDVMLTPPAPHYHHASPSLEWAFNDMNQRVWPQ